MSALRSDHAIIFKSVSDSENEQKDLYEEALQSAGFQATVVPVLDFEFVNLSELFAKLKKFEEYSGIIFTSPRCVTGLELSVDEANDRSLLDKWKSHKHFVVGEKTAKVAEKLGFVVDGKEAGNADKLSEIIAQENYNKPFLYPIGSLTMNSFKLKLKNNNIEVDDIMIYKTKPHSQLEDNIRKIKVLGMDKLNYFIYFSPSGVNFTLPILQKLEFDLSQVKFIAIGPTTETALIESGLKVANTASKPNPAALLEAVLSLRNT